MLTAFISSIVFVRFVQLSVNVMCYFFFILVQLSSPSGDLCEKRIQTFFWSCRHSSLLSSFCEPFSCSSLEMMDLAKKGTQKGFFAKQYFFKTPLSSFCCMSYDRSMTRGVISAYWSSLTNDSPVLITPGQSEAGQVSLGLGLSNCVTNTSRPGVTPCHAPVSPSDRRQVSAGGSCHNVIITSVEPEPEPMSMSLVN